MSDDVLETVVENSDLVVDVNNYPKLKELLTTIHEMNSVVKFHAPENIIIEKIDDFHIGVYNVLIDITKNLNTLVPVYASLVKIFTNSIDVISNVKVQYGIGRSLSDRIYLADYIFVFKLLLDTANYQNIPVVDNLVDWNNQYRITKQFQLINRVQGFYMDNLYSKYTFENDILVKEEEQAVSSSGFSEIQREVF